jgi:hypothetical protein
VIGRTGELHELLIAQPCTVVTNPVDAKPAHIPLKAFFKTIHQVNCNADLTGRIRVV